jgi:hypothetical protein
MHFCEFKYISSNSNPTEKSQYKWRRLWMTFFLAFYFKWCFCLNAYRQDEKKTFLNMTKQCQYVWQNISNEHMPRLFHEKYLAKQS